MSTISGIDAVALAIFAFESGHLKDPAVLAVRQNNPGNLETAGKKNIYPDFVTGYSALLRELHAKFSGNNAHGIGPDSTLLDLFNIYAPPTDDNPTNAYCAFVASWCTIALGRPISSGTKLGDIWHI